MRVLGKGLMVSSGGQWFPCTVDIKALRAQVSALMRPCLTWAVCIRDSDRDGGDGIMGSLHPLHPTRMHGIWNLSAFCDDPNMNTVDHPQSAAP